jgi:N utilization substance protein A
MSSSEILQIAEAVARDEAIPREAVIEALEEAIRVAARRKYGYEHSIRAEIDRRTGETQLYREMLVVEEAEDEVPEDIAEQFKNINKIPLELAKLKNSDAEVGDILSEPLPAIDLGRVAAQSAKQVLAAQVREIKRDKQFSEFKERLGEIMHGVVDKIEHGNVIVKIGNAEAILYKDQQLRTDKLKQGDRVRALLCELRKEGRGPQIILSRTHNDFLIKLFAQEVPEIYDGIIVVRAVARDPGLRAKMAVQSSDSTIDAVGSCVGARGSRVQAVISELQGEKIDIIPWSNDPATLAVHALAPASVAKVIIDEDQGKIELVIPDEQLNIAIGRRGQNIKLASELVGWNLDVVAESDESKRRFDEFSQVTKILMEALDVEEILAQLLASEGYTNIRLLAESDYNDIAGIEGLDMDIAQELVERAKIYLSTMPKDSGATGRKAKSKLDKLMQVEGMTEELALSLKRSSIATVIDLADLSRDEFIELVTDSGLSTEEIDRLIMNARALAFA